MKLQQFAVMGNPIDHSLSPMIHQSFAEQMGLAVHYEKRLVEVTQFEQQVHEFFMDGGKGLNITLPFKKQAYEMSDVATPRCRQAQAANTLWMKEGRLYADNTDGIGLLRDLNKYLDLTGKVILLLGAGGAARGVLGALLTVNPKKLVICNRTIEKAEELCQQFSGLDCQSMDDLHGVFDVIINATSASLESAIFPVSSEIMSHLPFCYDLAYQKNGDTAFVTWSKEQGCMAVDGFGMLVEQAAESFSIWQGVTPNTEKISKNCLI